MVIYAYQLKFHAIKDSFFIQEKEFSVMKLDLMPMYDDISMTTSTQDGILENHFLFIL